MLWIQRLCDLLLLATPMDCRDACENVLCKARAYFWLALIHKSQQGPICIVVTHLDISPTRKFLCLETLFTYFSSFLGLLLRRGWQFNSWPFKKLLGLPFGYTICWKRIDFKTKELTAMFLKRNFRSIKFLFFLYPPVHLSIQWWNEHCVCISITKTSIVQIRIIIKFDCHISSKYLRDCSCLMV